jgi:hypothetical protein
MACSKGCADRVKTNTVKKNRDESALTHIDASRLGLPDAFKGYFEPWLPWVYLGRLRITTGRVTIRLSTCFRLDFDMSRDFTEIPDYAAHGFVVASR